MTITNVKVIGAKVNSNTITTASWTTTSGSLIVVVGAWYAQLHTPIDSDVVDNKSNTFTMRGYTTNGSNEGVGVWSNQGGTRGATHTITFHNLSGSNLNVAVAEFTTDGSWNSPAFDSGTFATASDATSPLAITAAGAISGSVVAIFGASVNNGASGTWTPSSGYSDIFNWGDGTGFLTSEASYKIAETGTPSLSVAYSAAITSARELFATFSETGGSGTNVTPTAVAATFVVPTPTFTLTTTPTPTAVAQSWTIPTPVVSTSVSATLTKVTGVFTIPTPVPTVQTNISVTAVAATFVVPTPTFTRTTTPTPTAVAAAFVIPSPSVTTGSNVNIGATALAGTFTIPTPAIAGTQVAATAAVQTWVIPTPAIAGTQIAATAVAALFVIPTPSVTTGSTTSVTPAAVAMVAAVPTPTFNRTTTPTPTAVAMICAVPTPGYTASAAILATVVAAVFVVRGGVPTGQVIGGNATQTLTQAQGASQTITVQGATQELNP